MVNVHAAWCLFHAQLDISLPAPYLHILKAEVVLVFEVGSTGAELHQHLGDLGLYGRREAAGRLHHVLLHVLELHGSFGVARVSKHAPEEVRQEGAGTAENVQSVQVLWDPLLDVGNRGRGVARPRNIMASGKGGAYRCQRGRSGAGGPERRAKGLAQLGQRVLLVLVLLLRFLLGPAKQEASLIVHFTFLRAATIHK